MLNRSGVRERDVQEMELVESGSGLHSGLKDLKREREERAGLLGGVGEGSVEGALTLRDKKALALLVALCTSALFFCVEAISLISSPFPPFPLPSPVKMPCRPPPRYPRRSRLRIHPLPPPIKTLLLANRPFQSLHLPLLPETPLVPGRRLNLLSQTRSTEELDRPYPDDRWTDVLVVGK
jgi:hypothetical protein